MRFHDFIKETLGDPARIAALQLLRHHRHLTGRELARLTGVSQFKIRGILAGLRESGLLKMGQTGRSHLYSLNPHHLLVQRLGPLLTLEADIFAVLGAWVMERLKAKPRSLVLYGSAARREERPDSDIDLLLIYPKVRSPDEMLADIQEALADGPQVFGNRFAPVLSTITVFKNSLKRHDPFYKKILKEGIVIAGLSITELIA